MIAQLDRVEREAAEKRLREHRQADPSVIGSTSLSGPANPGICITVGSDGKSQPPASSTVAAVSWKRTDSGRNRRQRANSPLQPVVGCCVVVVETETGLDKDRLRFSESSITTDPYPTTVIGTCRDGSATGLAARPTAAMRRLSPSPSAHARLDRSCCGGSATMTTTTTGSPAWFSTADGRLRSARVHSFAERRSLTSTAVPPEEIAILLPPTHIEVHRTVSWSPNSSVEVPINDSRPTSKCDEDVDTYVACGN